MSNTPIQLAGIQGGRDEQTGLVSCVIPWWVPNFEDAFTVGDPFILTAVPQVDREFGVWDPDFTDNGYQVGIRYEGIEPGTGQEREESWEYDGEWKEEPIEKHWNIDVLKRDYGAYFDANQNLKFPEFLPKDSQSVAAAAQGFGQGLDSDKDVVNPLLGHKTYPLYLAVYSRTYVLENFPNEVVAAVGSILDAPRGLVGATPEGRNWLFMPPRVAKRGNAIEVTERLKMSPPGGWPEAIYDISTSGARTIKESPRNRSPLPAVQ